METTEMLTRYQTALTVIDIYCNAHVTTQLCMLDVLNVHGCSGRLIHQKECLAEYEYLKVYEIRY